MTQTSSFSPLRVAIIGGGLSGALVAWHLAGRTTANQVSIRVIEPRAELGRGLAYSTEDRDHRLNVPATKMTMDTRDPGHYQRWLASAEAPFLPAGAATLAGDIFTPRSVFGQYVAHHLGPALASGRITHERSRAIKVARGASSYRVTLEDGGSLAADVLVLAASHPAPGLPKGLAGIADHPAVIADAYGNGALDRILADETVLIVGSGLTGADIVASLHGKGHRGPIFMMSRHGRRPKGQAPRQSESRADFVTVPEVRATALLWRIRRAVAADIALGLSWHAALDRVRAQAAVIWGALPIPERARVLRHLRGLWDVHRFRIAPQTQAALDAEERAGRLHPVAGTIVRAQPRGPEVAVDIAPREGGDLLHLDVGHIVLATGPAHGAVLASNPVLADLARQGLIAADPLGLGIATTAEGAVPGSDGTIFVAGPLARGAVGELMGVPEITAWSEGLARRIAEKVPVALAV